MLTAALWGLVGGGSLVLGALVGVLVDVSYRTIGLVMAFGSGVLISAVAFDLTEEAFQSAGATPVVTGLVAGAVAFFVGDWFIDRRGGHRRKNPTGMPQQGAGAMALVLGALLDGIPESAAIGVSLLGGGSVSVSIVVAVFLSNVPESMSASAGLKRAGRSTPQILRLWTLIMVASGVAAAAGYGLLGGASPSVVAFTLTFAAGAIVTMLADTMMPEASEHAGRLGGLLTMAGFTLSFLLGAVA